MGVIIVRPAAARLVIIIETVLDFCGNVFFEPARESGLNAMTLILNAQRQSAGKIILAIIRLGKSVAGEHIGGLAENISAVGEDGVDVATIRNDSRRAVRRRNQAGGFV